MTELRTDGPHSPDYTRQVAGQLSECVRVLNHATRGDGLVNPADAYELLGQLKETAGGLPQLLGQIDEFLERSMMAGNLTTSSGSDVTPASAVARADSGLSAAQANANELYRSCDRAQQAITWLAAR